MIEKLSLLQETFIQQALLAALVAGLLCGFMAPLFNWRKLGFLGDSVAHASLTPSALSLLFNIPLQLILIPFSLFFSASLVKLEERGEEEISSIVAVLFSGFLALGILIISVTKKGSSEVMHMLLGDILLVTWSDFFLLLGVLVLASAYLTIYKREILLLLLHKELAQTEGVNVKRHNLTIMLMAGLTVAVSLKMMGIILMTSLLTIPSLIASRFTHSVQWHIAFSALTGVMLTGLGFMLSVISDLPSGATIAALGFLIYLLSQSVTNKSLVIK